MELKEEFITPEIASNYLEKNPNNRKVKEHVVLRYAEDMTSGRWKSGTGETIKIAWNGTVLDGQHRLLAIVKSQKGGLFHIAKGCSPEIFDVIDSGVPRSGQDVFYVEGVKYAALLPAIISSYLSFKRGFTKRRGKIPYSHLLALYNEENTFWGTVAQKASTWYQAFGKVISPTLIGSFYAHFSKIDFIDAERFFNQLCTGVDCSQTVNLLRQKLITDRLSHRRATVTQRNSLIIKAWNSFRKGENLKVLKFSAEIEDYPVAI